jgi:hypothetical protein
MQAIQKQPATVTVGRSAVPFSSYKAASELYLDAIRATGATSGCGDPSRAAPHCFLRDEDGAICGRVTYNGRVWACTEDSAFNNGLQCLYRPA